MARPGGAERAGGAEGAEDAEGRLCGGREVEVAVVGLEKGVDRGV